METKTIQFSKEDEPEWDTYFNRESLPPINEFSTLTGSQRRAGLNQSVECHPGLLDAEHKRRFGKNKKFVSGGKNNRYSTIDGNESRVARDS